jgi:glycosyltransferase involved in cell wall biosynthesis
MRIGINCRIVGGCNSGVEYYAASLARYLPDVAPHNDYTVFANSQPKDVAGGQVESQAAGWRPGRLLSGRLRRIAWEHAVLPFLARRHGLDLLHCPAYICPIVRALPTVVTVHDTIALDHPEWCRASNAWYFGLLLRHSISSADRVIAVSETTARDIARHVPGASRKVTVIHPGIDPLFRPVRDPDVLGGVRHRYDLPTRYVLYVGNLEPKKNLMRLILAFQRFRRRGNNAWDLVIAGGKTWGLSRQMEELRRQGQLQNVRFPGYVRREDLPCVYSQAGVFAFPSLYEGFGFPPLEAMACGTPVVASVCGALAETLAGAIVPVDAFSPESIADGLHTVVHDDILRQRLIEAGRARVSRFTWTDAARQTLAAYEQVLMSGAPCKAPQAAIGPAARSQTGRSR